MNTVYLHPYDCDIVHVVHVMHTKNYHVYIKKKIMLS